MYDFGEAAPVISSVNEVKHRIFVQLLTAQTRWNCRDGIDWLDAGKLASCHGAKR